MCTPMNLCVCRSSKKQFLQDTKGRDDYFQRDLSPSQLRDQEILLFDPNIQFNILSFLFHLIAHTKREIEK